MVKILGVDFVGLTVPFERRLQTLAVLHYTSLFLFAPIVTILVFLFFLITPLFWISLGYAAWVYYDYYVQAVSSHGGRRSQFMRRAAHMKYFRDFFPISLVKTADLDPGKNYIFGYHPHGIMSCGAFCNFASEATGFSEKFPGITPHMLTLKPNFRWPLLRGYILWMGCCDVSKESIEWILTKQGKGNAAVIVVGGAAEALEARPGGCAITLKKRKGFVKVAIRAGADLVPVFSFGENDLFNQVGNPEGSWLRYFQEKFKNFSGFSPPMFYGRGVFNYSFGLLPHRKPINTVVGSPIVVEKCQEPTQEMIDDIHQKYMNGLSEIFDKHKVDYGIESNLTLSFV